MTPFSFTIFTIFIKDWREFNLKLHQYLYHYNQEKRYGGSGIGYLTPVEKLLKLELESSLKENKGRSPSTEIGRSVEEVLTINPNHFVTELVR